MSRRPPQLHGPYLAWTRKVNGKTVTRSLGPEQAARYQPWFDNARRLRELITELQRLAVEQAETAEGWPRTCDFGRFPGLRWENPLTG